NLFIMNRAFWDLRQEIMKNIYVLLVCSTLNYIYNINFINDVSFSMSHLLSMCFYTIAIALPVTLIYVLGRYLYLLKQWETPANEQSEPTGNMLAIRPDFGPDMLDLSEEDFLFAESDGNYTTVHYIKGDSAVSQLLRLSLKSLEQQVANNSIMRCHRSYIVNMGRVAKVKGNAQGYRLFIENASNFVPVSRNYISKVKDKVGIP
uniref:LytTR family DNA-binding domain-containing protein n=1 Tax=uncultured Flavobacterium sp. TaxID=165435 RepID=UPI0025CE7D5A